MKKSKYYQVPGVDVERVPAKERYSRKKISEITDRLVDIVPGKDRERIGLDFSIVSGCRGGITVYIEFIQDTVTQNIIKDVQESGKPPNPENDYGSGDWMAACAFKGDNRPHSREELTERQINEMKASYILTKNGRLNKRFDNDYFSSLDIDKIHGYYTHLTYSIKEDLAPFRKITPEVMNRRFNE